MHQNNTQIGARTSNIFLCSTNVSQHISRQRVITARRPRPSARPYHSISNLFADGSIRIIACSSSGIICIYCLADFVARYTIIMFIIHKTYCTLCVSNGPLIDGHQLCATVARKANSSCPKRSRSWSYRQLSQRLIMI